MPQTRGAFVRENAFLVAAISLPLLVVAFFLVSSIVPRWMVPPPAYDLLVSTEGVYDSAGPRVSVEYAVRDGKVEATIRPLSVPAYQRPAALFLFDHKTMTAREVPVDLPRDLGQKDPPRTRVVDALAGRRVTADAKAPDGYQFETRTRRGPGIVGELFGMNRYDPGAALVNKGRVVQITLSGQYPYYTVRPIGWVVD
jgi:hypothetical protein